MVAPNYTYLKLKMTGPKGVITIEGSFKQTYYCEQDYVTQAATLITPYAPDGLGYDVGRALTKEASEVVATLDQPSISEAAKAPSGSDGSTSPSI